MPGLLVLAAAPAVAPVASGISAGTAALYGAGASIIGGLVSSAFGYKSSKDQMKFQEKMSSTSHQREVKDLRAAGLNPILSAMGGSGASSPQGARVTPENPMKGMSEKMLAMVLAKENIKKIAAEIKNITQQTYTSASLEDKLDQETMKTSEETATEQIRRSLLNYNVNEAKSSSDLYKNIGQGGKGAKIFLPLLLKLLGTGK